MFSFTLQIIFQMLLLTIDIFQAVDLTIEPLAKGHDVSLAVVRKIVRSGIFEEDDFFLTHRVAYIATKFGEDPKTYEEGSSYRGIWQLTESQLNETKLNPELANIRQKIPIAFPQIGQWELVTWNDLLKPLHNGLAFRLFAETLKELSNFPPFLPTLLIDQADFYTQFFNESFNPTEFVEDTLMFESNPKCATEMDIVFVQDGSCTVYPVNMTNYLTLSSALVDSFEFEKIRVGLVVFSTLSVPNFSLDNNFTQEELRENILNATRPFNQYTRTELGIKDGLAILQSGSPRPRGVPQLLIVTTDGVSIDYLDKITNETMEAGVNSFVIGTAFGWNNMQMLQIAHNQPSRIFKSGYSFNMYPELLYPLHLEICAVTTNPELNSISSSTLQYGQKRYYKFSFSQATEDYIMITLVVNQGEIRSFYSYEEQSPGTALRDGEIEAGFTNFIFQNNYPNVYIVFEGVQTVNSFTFLAN